MTYRMVGLSTAASVALGLAASTLWAQPLSKRAFDVCLQQGVEIVGETPVLPARHRVPQPRRRVDVLRTLPDVPIGTLGSGMWVGEALVRKDGTVARVWTLREPTFAPPFPAYVQTIVESFGRWEYEPLRIDGVARPFCVTFTLNINWQ